MFVPSAPSETSRRSPTSTSPISGSWPVTYDGCVMRTASARPRPGTCTSIAPAAAADEGRRRSDRRRSRHARTHRRRRPRVRRRAGLAARGVAAVATRRLTPAGRWRRCQTPRSSTRRRRSGRLRTMLRRRQAVGARSAIRSSRRVAGPAPCITAVSPLGARIPDAAGHRGERHPHRRRTIRVVREHLHVWRHPRRADDRNHPAGAQTRKGKVRLAMAEQLRTLHDAGDLRVCTAWSDYFGPRGTTQSRCATSSPNPSSSTAPKLRPAPVSNPHRSPTPSPRPSLGFAANTTGALRSSAPAARHPIVPGAPIAQDVAAVNLGRSSICWASGRR